MALLGCRSRAALHRFENHALVHTVNVVWDRITVRYVTGQVEHWGLDHGRRRRLMFPRHGWWQHEIGLLPEYTDLGSPPDPETPMWSVPFSEYRQAGFLDQRIAVQEMTARLLREGWVDPVTPTDWLDWDLQRLGRSRPERFLVTPGYLRQQAGRSHRPPHGFSVACALASWADHEEERRPTLRSAFEDVGRIYWGVESCVGRKRDVNRVGLLHAMTSGRAEGHPSKVGPRLMQPGLWSAILRGVCGLTKPVVLDESGCPGFLAAAVVADQGIYIHPPRWPVRRFAPAWAERHGAALLADDGSTADVGYLGDLRMTGLPRLRERVEEAHARCATVVAIVDRDDGFQLRSERAGVDVIRFHRWRFRRQDDALLVVRQR